MFVIDTPDNYSLYAAGNHGPCILGLLAQRRIERTIRRAALANQDGADSNRLDCLAALAMRSDRKSSRFSIDFHCRLTHERSESQRTLLYPSPFRGRKSKRHMQRFYFQRGRLLFPPPERRGSRWRSRAARMTLRSSGCQSALPFSDSEYRPFKGMNSTPAKRS